MRLKWKKIVLIFSLSFATALIGLVFYTSSVNNFYVPSGKEYSVEVRGNKKFFKVAHVEYREGIPFLYLKGDSYEIGLQYGVLLRKEMKSFYAEADSLEDLMMNKIYDESPWYMDFVIWISSPFVVISKLKSFRQKPACFGCRRI